MPNDFDRRTAAMRKITNDQYTQAHGGRTNVRRKPRNSKKRNPRKLFMQFNEPPCNDRGYWQLGIAPPTGMSLGYGEQRLEIEASDRQGGTLLKIRVKNGVSGEVLLLNDVFLSPIGGESAGFRVCESCNTVSATGSPYKCNCKGDEDVEA